MRLASRAPGGVDWSPWWLAPEQAGVVSDYDGTLAPIVEDRDRARPVPGAREVLATLAGELAIVAVVSGRPLAYLERHLGGIERVQLLGLYGLERQQGSEHQVATDALRWRPVVEALAAEAAAEAPTGVELEHKGLSFVLHARHNPNAMPWARDWAGEKGAAAGLKVQPGRMSVELLPPTDMDKGGAVVELAASLGAVCYMGDDTGDLAAFGALDQLRAAGKTTVAVGVGSREQPAELARAVDHMVDGPEEAVELLDFLATRLASR